MNLVTIKCFINGAVEGINTLVRIVKLEEKLGYEKRRFLLLIEYSYDVWKKSIYSLEKVVADVR